MNNKLMSINCPTRQQFGSKYVTRSLLGVYELGCEARVSVFRIQLSDLASSKYMPDKHVNPSVDWAAIQLCTHACSEADVVTD